MRGSIRARREYDAVYEHGLRRHGRFAVLFLLTPERRAEHLGPEGDDTVRLGIVASRRVGGAVQRNRAKRLLRAASRDLVAGLAPGSRLVLVARRTIVDATVRSTAVAIELQSLLDQCGLEADEKGRLR